VKLYEINQEIMFDLIKIIDDQLDCIPGLQGANDWQNKTFDYHFTSRQRYEHRKLISQYYKGN
jgi:hypothetical protein